MRNELRTVRLLSSTRSFIKRGSFARFLAHSDNKSRWCFVNINKLLKVLCCILNRVAYCNFSCHICLLASELHLMLRRHEKREEKKSSLMLCKFWSINKTMTVIKRRKQAENQQQSSASQMCHIPRKFCFYCFDHQFSIDNRWGNSRPFPLIFMTKFSCKYRGTEKIDCKVKKKSMLKNG